MVDFDGGKRSDFDLENSADESIETGSNLLQDAGASYSPGTRILAPDANGVVVLPEGVALEDISVRGLDLVIVLADGTELVIPGGAVVVPQFVVDGVAIAPQTVSDYLNGIDPEAPPGNATPSSGGNFAGDEGAIQDAFDIGDLLPYTELSRSIEEEREVIPYNNDEPEVVIETPDNPVGVENAIATVHETGLPGNGDGEGERNEPPGIGENEDGIATNDSDTSETTSGTIVFSSPDGLSAVIINGVEVTTVGQEFVTPYGTMTITSIDLDAGEIGFSYTLFDNLLGETADGNFFVTVRDLDGDEASASLSIIVVDDSPLAADDIGIVPAGTHAPITGNVLVNDQSGADDYVSGEGGLEAVTGFTNGSATAAPGATLQGDYGTLTLNADGSYTYTRDYNTPGGVEDTFRYTIVDQDGSTSEAELLIRIEDAPDTIDFIPDDGDGTVVDEGGLPPRGDKPVGTGEGADDLPNNDSDQSETTSGTITFTSPDGVQSVIVAGVTLDPGNLPQTVVDDETGTLVITDYTYDPVTGVGTITYEYTLGDNTSGDNTSVSFPIEIIDLDGDSTADDGPDNLVITIIDDEPEVAPDTDEVTEDTDTSASGNVMTDAEANGDNGADTEGADGATVTGVAAGNAGTDVSGNVGTSVSGLYGSITIGADGNYTYTLDNSNPVVQGLDGTESLSDEVFTYTITDGDGDTRTTTITITVNGTDDPVVITGLDGEGAEEVVDEDDLSPDGSSPDVPALTQGGEFTVNSVDGLTTVTVGGVTVFDSSAATVYPVTVTGDYGEVRITGVSVTTDAGGDVVSATFTYEYELTGNTLDHSPVAGENSVFDNFEVIAKDSDGSEDIASLDVEVIDDIPDVSVADIGAPILATDDTDLLNSASSVDDGDFSSLFTTLYGADGAHATDAIAYALSINGGDGTASGLQDSITDEAILLRISAGDPNVIEGYLETSGDVAFTLTLDPATGVITQEQFRAIEHDNPADYEETQASGEAQTMAADLISLTATVTDGDGDTDSASVNIGGSFAFEDDFSLGGLIQGGTVDEDALAGIGANDSQPGDNLGNASFTGTFSINFGADGPGADELTVALASLTATDPNGGTVAMTSGGVAVLTTWDAATNTLTAYTTDPADPVLTLVFDFGTSTWTATLFKPLDHPSTDNGSSTFEGYEDNLNLAANFTFVDGDGDTVVFNGIGLLSIDDDMAVANGDEAAQETENVAFTIDALDNDVFGADGVDTTDATKVFVSTQASQGTVTYDPVTGLFTYTPNAGAGSDQNTSDFFEYTIIDGDGDASTARVAITLRPDSEPVVDFVTAAVDDDGLDGANPAGDANDIDATAGSDPASATETVFNGSIDVDFGADGGTVSFSNLHGTSGSVGEESVDYSWDAGSNTLTATGPRGDLFTVTLAPDGTYTVTLLDNVIHADGNGETSAPAVVLNYLATDNDDGDTDATGTLTIEFNDDIPTATDNSNSVGEGEATDGNVLTDNDGDGLDVAGADGYADAGPVVDAGFSSSNPAGVTLDNKSVAPDGTITLTTSVGTLVINTDGSYEFTSTANTVNADTSLTFTYTIEDGDGDQSTADLVIDIDNVAGKVDDNDAKVYEAGLDGIGSDGGANSEFFTTGQITVTDATGPFFYTLLDPASGNYGTLTLNADGSYSYELTAPIDGDLTGDGGNNGNNEINDQESFDYEVRDGANNLIGSGTIVVTIVDDVPSVDIAANGDISEDLTTFDADTVGGTSTDSADFSGGFNLVSVVQGADQAANTVVDYDLNLVVAQGTATGLFSDEAPIYIWERADGTIVGSTNGSEVPATNDATVVFTLTVDTVTGIVTLTQFAELDHSGTASSPAYDSDSVPLPTGLVEIEATATITDADGDIDSDADQIDLGDYVNFADDGPFIDIDVTDGDTVMLMTDDDQTEGDASDTDVSTGNFGSAFTIASSDYGADGAGTTEWNFHFEVVSAASNLSSDGDPIFLHLIGGKVVGSTQSDVNLVDASNTVFDLSVVSATGVVTLTQYAEIDHGDTDEGEPYDVDVATLANGLVLLHGDATIYDEEGDSYTDDSNSLDLGGNIKFADDGPSVSDVAADGAVDVDESDAVNPAGFPISDTSTDPVLSYSEDYGADGAGTVTFALVATEGLSGLATAVGDQPITIVQIDATHVEGQYGAGLVAFEVVMNANGTVTLTQNVALEHLEDGDDSLGEYNDLLDLDGLVSATVTVTDEEGDYVTSDPVNIGANLKFYDDGPSVDLTATEHDLTVSDADYATDATMNFADAFDFDGGADGTASTTYTLEVTDGTASGLFDNASNLEVFLFMDGDDVIGLFGTDSADALANGQEVFRVSVDGSGNVKLDQSRAIDHTLSTVSDGVTASLASDGLIQLVGTVYDNDGDFDSISLDIGSNLFFTDDTPTAETTLTAYLDDDTQTDGIDGGPDDQAPNESNLTGSLVDDVEGFGNDGGTAAFALTGAPAGFQYITDGSNGVLIQQEQGPGNWVTVVHVTLDPATGNYAVSQEANVWHENDGNNDENEQSFTLSGTLTDGDGDTAPVSLDIVVDDDTPEAVDFSLRATVDEDGIVNGIADNGTNDAPGDSYGLSGTIAPSFHSGADTPLTFSFIDADTARAYLLSLNLTSGGQPLSYNVVSDGILALAGGNQVFIFDLQEDGDYQFTLYAPLDHADADDSENVNDIEINFGSLFQATDVDGDTVGSSGSFVIVIDDDTPRANNDTDSLTEDDASTGGNVVLGTGTDSGAAGTDEGGADGFADPVLTAITGSGGAGVVGGDTIGSHGTLVINNDGSYVYTITDPSVQVLDDTEFYTDTFTYTIEDADGDAVTATLTITINGVNDAPVANADTNWIVEDAGPVAGNVIAGELHNGAPDAVDRADVADSDVDIEALTVAVADTGTISGTYGELTLNTDGTYSYRLYTEAEDATAYAAVQALNVGDTPLTDTFNYNAYDGTAESNETSLTISIFGSNDAPVVVADAVAVSDEGFADGNKDTTGNPSDNSNSLTAIGQVVITDTDDATHVVTLVIPTDPLAVADGSVNGAAISWRLDNGDKTLIGEIDDPDNPGDKLLAVTIEIDNDGNFSVVQSLPIFHPDAASEDTRTLTIDVNVADSATTVLKTDAITVTFEDDSPTLGPVQDQQASNDPTQTPAVGGFNLSIGGDDLGSMVITADTSTITSGGLAVLTHQDGNILYGYVDDGTGTPGNGSYDSGDDTIIFTLTVDPDAGTSGQYTFDLVNALDPTITDVPIGAGSSFGVGPSASVIVTDDDSGVDLVYVTGWAPAAGFNPADPTTWVNMTQTSNVNGSTQGWGLGNNNFDQGEFLRFDFGDLNDYDGGGVYTPPGGQDIADVSYATFSFFNFDTNGGGKNPPPEIITFVAHYTNGTTQTFVIDGKTDTGTFTINAPAGTYIDWIDAYMTTGEMKLNLTNVGVADSSIDKTIDFSLQVLDGDGDPTATQDFSVHIADGLSPFPTAVPTTVVPLVLDLDGGGADFSGLAANIAYDYDGDGIKTKTAWIAAGSAILAYDMNADGLVTNASEFVFGRDGMTDLEALSVDYDSNADGVLDANDASFGGFGIWLDSNLDGVSDAGEFMSLSDAGIVSIDLTSDGNIYEVAGGDVVVFGTASYTMEDGSTGEVADAGFMTGSDVDGTMEALLALTAENDAAADDADLGVAKTTQDMPEVAAIVDDALAGQQVDAMLDAITGAVHNDALAAKAGYLFGHDALNLNIDGGAFAFDNGTMADMHEDAAALVAANV
ncbi:DUF5801 repeats-in-toxin domain-containing protein [Altererythrobacter epoxidivorans]|nr:DUF5801 repeats-in-toxin domain-containing protein [Altererythrobacter epoxidivorans]